MESVPPDVERTLTVGREAILEDSLDGLDVAGDADELAAAEASTKDRKCSRTMASYEILTSSTGLQNPPPKKPRHPAPPHKSELHSYCPRVPIDKIISLMRLKQRAGSYA